MIEVFQVLRFALAMSSQADAYAIELNKITDAATGENADQAVFLEAIETLAEPALEKVTHGNALDFVALWEAINSSEAPSDWVVDALQPIIKDVVELRINSPRKIGTQTDGAWLLVFETMIATPDLKMLPKLKSLAEIPADHMILAITTENGKRATRWWYSLGEKRRSFFLKCARDQNRLLNALQAAINPDGLETKDIEPKTRIPRVRAYLAHPFLHYAQPFQPYVFSQLINYKCLTAEELFEDPDGFVNLHFRQGLAYLDLARIYRKSKRYKDALGAVNQGMTTRLQTGNRLGFYLLERAIIYRDAGDFKAARRSLDSVPMKQLDGHNKGVFKEIDESLNENDS